MQIDLKDLRARYSRFSDAALIDAYEQGSEAYLPQAWEVITQEIKSRGIPVPEPETEAQLPGSTAAAEEPALQVAIGLLKAGSTPPEVKARLLKKGMNASDLDILLAPLFAEWRTATERHARKQMKTGAIWAVGGLVVTLVGYSAVVQSGGSYIVAWGAILFGSIRFFEGLALSQKARRQ